MNRNELVDAVAGKADLSKTAASKAVEAVFESITGALKGGGEVRLVGFGTFSVASRAEGPSSDAGSTPAVANNVAISRPSAARISAMPRTQTADVVRLVMLAR